MDSIFQTVSYDIIIEPSPDKDQRAAGVLCYGIRNRKYGVVEAHVGTLPSAIQVAVDLTKALKDGPLSMETRVERQLSAMGIDTDELRVPGSKKLSS